MGKLLHERLRECAERCVDEIDVNGVWIYPLTPTEFVALADEIERCYHPKPVDGDGKPWELGDDCITDEGEDATIVGYRPGGRVFIDLHDEREFARCYASDLKRPPKVLDADGVEIHEGDTVYLLPGDHCDEYPLNGYVSGVAYTVRENSSKVHKAYGRICIKDERKRHFKGYPLPEQVTHREPDSLEKLRDDIASDPEGMSRNTILTRLTALIERGA